MHSKVLDNTALAIFRVKGTEHTGLKRGRGEEKALY
jgi:hypothetical protein